MKTVSKEPSPSQNSWAKNNHGILVLHIVAYRQLTWKENWVARHRQFVCLRICRHLQTSLLNTTWLKFLLTWKFIVPNFPTALTIPSGPTPSSSLNAVKNSFIEIFPSPSASIHSTISRTTFIWWHYILLLSTTCHRICHQNLNCLFFVIIVGDFIFHEFMYWVCQFV